MSSPACARIGHVGKKRKMITGKAPNRVPPVWICCVVDGNTIPCITLHQSRRSAMQQLEWKLESILLASAEDGAWDDAELERRNLGGLLTNRDGKYTTTMDCTFEKLKTAIGAVNETLEEIGRVEWHIEEHLVEED